MTWEPQQIRTKDNRLEYAVGLIFGKEGTLPRNELGITKSIQEADYQVSCSVLQFLDRDPASCTQCAVNPLSLEKRSKVVNVPLNESISNLPNTKPQT